MSEGSSALVWQCVHCHEVLPGVSPGSFPFCPFCGGSQQPPLASGTSLQQPPGGGKPQETLNPQEPSTQVPPSFQSQPSQSSPPSQPGQLRASGTSPHHPPGDGKLHSQPPVPEASKEPMHSPQQPTSDNAPPETDEQMQVSTTQPPPGGSSTSETKTPLPPEPPLSHSSDIHPSSATASSSTDKLQTKGHDHHSTDPHSQHEQQKIPSENVVKVSNVANGPCEPTLAQGTVSPPETTTSTSEPPSGFPGLPEHPVSSEDDGKSEVNKGGQKRTAESDIEIPPAKHPRLEGNEEDTKKEPIVKAADSELEHTSPSPKLPKNVPTNPDPTANTNPTEPDNQPSQPMCDPLTGSATVIPNQVSLYCCSSSWNV